MCGKGGPPPLLVALIAIAVEFSRLLGRTAGSTSCWPVEMFDSNLLQLTLCNLHDYRRRLQLVVRNSVCRLFITLRSYLVGLDVELPTPTGG